MASLLHLAQQTGLIGENKSPTSTLRDITTRYSNLIEPRTAAGHATSFLQPQSVPSQDSLAPSLIVKAYAHALKSKLTFNTNLGATNKAIFITTPTEKGIPVHVAEEYSNEMLYQHANAIQTDNDLSFGHEGDYFEYLNQYGPYSVSALC